MHACWAAVHVRKEIMFLYVHLAEYLCDSNSNSKFSRIISSCEIKYSKICNPNPSRLEAKKSRFISPVHCCTSSRRLQLCLRVLLTCRSIKGEHLRHIKWYAALCHPFLIPSQQPQRPGDSVPPPQILAVAADCPLVRHSIALPPTSTRCQALSCQHHRDHVFWSAAASLP
jgi:hypothetical protein